MKKFCSVLFAALLAVGACGGAEKPAGGSAAATGADGTGTAATGAPKQSAKPARQKPRMPPKLDMMLITAYFGGEPTAPFVDNPSTPEKVALGKQLYHDTVVSKNGNLSCASCHDLNKYGQDGLAVSPGSDGKNGDRNSPTTLNAFRQLSQFWDGRAPTVEEQAIMPVLNPIEHGLTDEAQVVEKLESKPELVTAFGNAFPGQADPVTVENFKLAIGAFERTLVTRSPFDDFLDGKSNALTTDQKFGLKAFIDVGCTQCHTTRLVGGNLMQKLGAQRPYATEDQGRFQVTGNEADRFVFKVPSLLNIEKTAPYLHDGKVATLEESVRLMAQIQLNKDLTDEQVESIVAFLKALTGKVPEGAVQR